MADYSSVTAESWLGRKQELHAWCISQLLNEIYRQGYSVRLKEGMRGPQQAEWNATHCAVMVDGKRCEQHITLHSDAYEKSGGKKIDHAFVKIGLANTLHGQGLALDIVLVYHGEVTWADEHYKKFGEFWEGLHPLCCWGGRFKDGGHFSVTHGGRK